MQRKNRRACTTEMTTEHKAGWLVGWTVKSNDLDSSVYQVQTQYEEPSGHLCFWDSSQIRLCCQEDETMRANTISKRDVTSNPGRVGL